MGWGGGGKDVEAAARVGEGLASKVYRGFPLALYVWITIPNVKYSYPVNIHFVCIERRDQLRVQRVVNRRVARLLYDVLI